MCNGGGEGGAATCPTSWLEKSEFAQRAQLYTCQLLYARATSMLHGLITSVHLTACWFAKGRFKQNQKRLKLYPATNIESHMTRSG